MVESLVKSATTILRTARSHTQAWGSIVPLADTLEEIAKNRLVIFGEKHGNEHVIKFQTQI